MKSTKENDLPGIPVQEILDLFLKVNERRYSDTIPLELKMLERISSKQRITTKVVFEAQMRMLRSIALEHLPLLHGNKAL